MRVTMLAAVGRNRVIGARGGGLPWHIPEDLRHVKRVTMGQTLVLGRRTFEEFAKPLPGRQHVVLTSDRGYGTAWPEVVRVAHSLDEALALVTTPEAVIFGGAEVYRAAMPVADRLLLTEVDQAPDGDAYFPEVDPSVWEETEREPHDGFAFVTYLRRDRD